MNEILNIPTVDTSILTPIEIDGIPVKIIKGIELYPAMMVGKGEPNAEVL